MTYLLPALTDTTRRAQAAYFRASCRRAERDRRLDARVRVMDSGPVITLPPPLMLPAIVGRARPRLLDLFCGAGGAGYGYMQAGFHVTGVDSAPQPRYPGDMFVQGDALAFLEAHGRAFDVIHASPPCQSYSIMRRGRWQDREHPDLIVPVRSLLQSVGKPYVIENVSGSPLLDPLMLCGTMFGLCTTAGNELRRHRLFESSVFLFGQHCQHGSGSPIGVYGGGQHPHRRKPATIGVYGHAGGSSRRDGLTMFGTADRQDAMGIDWMSGAELSQAIPPAYTAYIGAQLRAAL